MPKAVLALGPSTGTGDPPTVGLRIQRRSTSPARLIVRETKVEAHRPANRTLFDVPAHGLREERRKQALSSNDAGCGCRIRARQTAVAWCHLNDESALLAELIDGAVEVAGSEAAEAKEEKLAAFTRGDIRCW